MSRAAITTSTINSSSSCPPVVSPIITKNMYNIRPDGTLSLSIFKCDDYVISIDFKEKKLANSRSLYAREIVGNKTKLSLGVEEFREFYEVFHKLVTPEGLITPSTSNSTAGESVKLGESKFLGLANCGNNRLLITLRCIDGPKHRIQQGGVLLQGCEELQRLRCFAREIFIQVQRQGEKGDFFFPPFVILYSHFHPVLFC